MLRGQVLQETLGADARPTAEKTLKVCFAEAHVTSDVVQFGLLAEMFFQVANRRFDYFVIGFHRNPLRKMSFLTMPKAGHGLNPIPAKLLAGIRVRA